MAQTLVHRGPDDRSEWADPDAGLALGFRRLSIVDLSPEGRQPMVSACGRYVLAINGEVYNFNALRDELEQNGEAPAFRGHSDTEVVLAAISAWGLEDAVRRTVGMFAFAVWDRCTRKLHLVRDRLGIKPLYYGSVGGSFLFGSELKALRVHPRFDASIDRNVLALFLRHNYIPDPYCIYQGFRKLTPGCILSVSADPLTEHLFARIPEPRAYWSAHTVAEAGRKDLFRGTETEAMDRLESVLTEAIRLRMIADVPLGAFLSGGIDSSTVVALMQAQSGRPVRTFSIGFHEDGFNEAQYAGAVARHLGTDHTELYVTPREAMDVVPRLPALYDEPFADSSQIPTFLVSQLARQHVTVALSGDGGDELFCGYNRYTVSAALWKRLERVPSPIRAALSAVLMAAPVRFWDRLHRLLSPVLPLSLRSRLTGDRVRKLVELLDRSGLHEVYLGLVSYWDDPARIVPGASEPRTVLTDRSSWAKHSDWCDQMMWWDLMTYLPGDILTKVDRASMGVSLEARVPLLDHRVVEFAWQLPLSLKMRSGQSKWLLRQLLYRHVPQPLIDRPKMGFGVPVGEWLRGPLREWAEDLLDDHRITEGGFLDPAPIRTRWQEHLGGSRNWQYHLWGVLMFQAWLKSTAAATE